MKKALLFLCIIHLATVLQVSAGGIVNTCTEQALLDALSGGGTVTFNCDGVISLSKTIDIQQSTVLDGNGFNVVLSGGGLVRLFSVATNVPFTLRGLVLADGVDARTNAPAATESGAEAKGGAILSMGALIELTNCTLTNNSATGGSAGNVDQNRTFPSGGSAFGGAVHAVGGSLSLSNCVLAGNYLLGGSASGPSGAAQGGAIYANETVVSVSDCKFFQNMASAGSVPFTDGNLGPGGDAEGGGIFITNAVLTVENCVFEDNRSLGARLGWSSGFGAGSGRGGAIRVGGLAKALVDKSRFITNQASGGGSPRYARGGGWPWRRHCIHWRTHNKCYDLYWGYFNRWFEPSAWDWRRRGGLVNGRVELVRQYVRRELDHGRKWSLGCKRR